MTIADKILLFLNRLRRGIDRRITLANLNRPNIKIGKNFSIGYGVVFDIHQDGLLEIGNNCIIADYSYITVEKGGVLIIGDDTYIFHHASISAALRIEIGKFCSFAPYVTVIDGNHNYEDIEKPIRFQGGAYKAVSIENEVWIGTKATILCGNRIGRHTVIAANSVVTSDIPQNSVACGSPARVIKCLGNSKGA